MADRRTDPRLETREADTTVNNIPERPDPDPTAAPTTDPTASLGATTDEITGAEATIAADAGPGADSAAGGGSIHASSSKFGDSVFASLTTGASGFVVLIVVLVGAFLVIKAVPSLAEDKASFLTSTQWTITRSGVLRFGVAGLLYTTVLSSIVALILAVPLAIGIALFITQYAPKRLARPVANTVDLLAAIPSIIYGVWGFRVLAPHLTGLQHALSHIGLGIFSNQNIDVGTVFDAGIVLAIMILPIITAISRDVFDRTPTANKEAALALGATRWEMIRMAVLPYGRPGVVSGAMLGLGRALGETIAVLLILSSVSKFNFSLFSGGQTIAAKIAAGSGEFGTHPGPYIAAGLVLFVLTFVVNGIARFVVNRRKDFVE
ncbi:MAG TPA: phosphate ABC transporter permease subunit PstC [Jatrophihabitans sp.]|jgi:phosphate transport system permease protein